ncbi:cobalt-precorrin-6A reductase [Gordonia soli]|uniref:Precorrin-6X reductase n=1 Tax=Gordonia soli NBRC 108243 TaxID=1223545 RepID=M0QNX3_9ACTN|nr:cobalt-precorrin-6A reductase [Gordonia soli]GAC70273.1 precorrin-6X reductase [Gordonia soli NBRC 108243]
MTSADEPILLLGGTGEARELAARLVATGTPVVSSLAGRVRQPRLPVGEVRIGGFGGVDGLREWVVDNRVRAIVDATHPFAATITRSAAEVASSTGVPLIRLRRPAWEESASDRWIRVPDMPSAAEAVRSRGAGRVFLTTGRQDVGVFADDSVAWYLIRVVDPPTGRLPARHELLQSRGPYSYADEAQILSGRQIDLLVTKNSGGDLTHAKLRAAADAGIEVVMVDRPDEPTIGKTVHSVEAAEHWVRGHLD